MVLKINLKVPEKWHHHFFIQNTLMNNIRHGVINEHPLPTG